LVREILKLDGNALNERWWRRRKRSNPWFSDVFEEFDRLEEMMDEMMRQAFEIPSREEEASKPYVFGFSVRVGPDGKPVIREFGNLHRGTSGTLIREESEPLVDVVEEKKEVVVVAELPGADKETIKVSATETHLTIYAETPQRKYHREVEFPARVYPKSAVASYKNGVLQVRLQKTAGELLFIE